MLQGTVAEGFFKLKGLSASAMARLEKSIKSSRDTLSIADRLQIARDNAKTLHNLEMSMKQEQKRSATRTSRLLDIFS